MIPGGYILQPRTFDSSEASKMPPCAREVWHYILRNVNHSNIGKHKRGSGFFNISEIVEALSWHVGYRKESYSKSQVAKAIRRLNEGRMIDSTKATRGLHISVCNYGYYQDAKNYEGHNEGSTKDQRRKSSGNTKDKNGKNKEEEKLIKDTFDLFWKEYPRKLSKAEAFKSWGKKECHNGLFETIMEALRRQKKQTSWLEKDKKYIPHPTTWLNQQRWEDEIEEDGDSQWK